MVSCVIFDLLVGNLRLLLDTMVANQTCVRFIKKILLRNALSTKKRVHNGSETIAKISVKNVNTLNQNYVFTLYVNFGAYEPSRRRRASLGVNSGTETQVSDKTWAHHYFRFQR